MDTIQSKPSLKKQNNQKEINKEKARLRSKKWYLINRDRAKEYQKRPEVTKQRTTRMKVWREK